MKGKCEDCFYRVKDEYCRFPPTFVFDPEDGDNYSFYPDIKKCNWCGEFVSTKKVEKTSVDEIIENLSK